MDDSMTAETKKTVDYESWYHSTRHSNHFNEDYYNARAKIALTKFFKDYDINQRILDFGCGLGQNIYYLPNAMGYDISEFGIEFCRKKGINATTNLDEVPDEGFDIVFSAHVLEHHPHPKTMIEDMYRKLKKGSTLILVIPFERHGKGKPEFDLNQHLYTWNFQAINNLLLTVGFEILENKYIRGAGYYRLLPLAKTNFNLYKLATNSVSRLAGIKEMMITARKP
ncbi:MAG: class I SAM-dependent methyltransferase [Chitinophagaceae bacterium]|nr:class I SAM-dependent methyltransferase [Chitinophagaceae bacterium]MCW5928523.1 class I SAM-dependent methyltransferase [Chitinophagaceae bacterium]